MLRKTHLKPLSKTLGILILASAMLTYPQDVLAAATQGLTAWAEYVLPALLPFFIISELLMGAGLVHLLGVLLEPVMRPIFRLPGASAFVLTMGFTSGPPIGAVLTTKLFKENLITRHEAERLITFTNNASPGFMLGAVSAGMFGNPALGLILAFANYLSNLLLGIGLRFYHPQTPPVPVPAGGTSLWRRGFQAMLQAQRKDKRPIGQLIGDSVHNSINTILVVGGFILFFSVLLRVLSILGVVQFLTTGLDIILSPLGLDPSLYPAIANGLFEMTLGTKEAALANAPLFQQLLLASAIMAWSGLSVLGQVASFTAGTGIRLTPFILGRGVHACLAAAITAAALHFTGAVPVFSGPPSALVLWKLEWLALVLAIFSAMVFSTALSLIEQIAGLKLKR